MKTRVLTVFFGGVFACTFPPPEQDAPVCDFSFRQLCGLTFAGTKTFNSQTLDVSGTITGNGAVSSPPVE